MGPDEQRDEDLMAQVALGEQGLLEYLVRRQREPGDVYAERLGRVFYQNYIGSIVDWYTATLFRE